MPEWSRTPMDSPTSLGASPVRNRSHREAANRLQQRLRKCAGGQWRVWTLFRRRHHPRFRDRLEEYKVLDVPRKITTAGGGETNGTAQGVLRGHVIDDKGVRRLIQLSCLIAPGLGRIRFSVKQAARNGVVSISDMTNPRLETHDRTCPLQELGHDLYYFSLDLAGCGNGSKLAMQAASNINLWHRRLGHLNRKSSSLLKNLDNNGVSFDGPVPDCDVCAVGKSHQLAHPKTADHKVKLPFQLVFSDLMGPLTPEALGGYKYSTKISDEYPKWTERYLLKSKHDALSSFQVFVQSVVIPSGFGVERSRVGKGGEFISKEFRDYRLQTGVSLEYASTNTPQQIGMSERVGRTLAAIVRSVYACRPRTAKVSVGRIDVHGDVSGQQGAALLDQHAVSVQNAARNGAGSDTSSSHPCPGLRAY